MRQKINSEMEDNISVNKLLEKLDQAIDDLEQGMVEDIDEAWKEIDTI